MYARNRKRSALKLGRVRPAITGEFLIERDGKYGLVWGTLNPVPTPSPARESNDGVKSSMRR